MSIQEAETQFYGIFPNAEHNVIKTGITLDVRDASDNKLPLEAYKIVKTYAAAESLIERKVDPSDNTVWYYDAYPGETISVVEDGPNNGLYVVMGTQDPSQNGLTLHRVIYSDDPSSAYALQTRSVDPSTSEVTVTPGTGYYGLSSVTVSAIDSSLDPDLVPGNIKKDVEIFGVTGTYEGSGGTVNNQDKTVDSSTTSQTVTADQGYTGLGTVTVNPYTTATDSSTLTQNGTYVFTPGNADALSQVTVDVSVAGSGGGVNNQNKSVNPRTSQQTVTADQGYTGLGTVTVNAVTSSIDSNISAGNIKKDVTILGIRGTYDASVEMNRTTALTIDNVDTSALWPYPSGYPTLGMLQPTNVKLGGINENFVVNTADTLGQIEGVYYGHAIDGFVNIDGSVGSNIKSITYNVNALLSRNGFATSGPICTSTNAPSLQKISFPMSRHVSFGPYTDVTGWFTPWKNDIEYNLEWTWFHSSDASINLTHDLGSRLVNLTIPNNYIGGNNCYLGWASNLNQESAYRVLQSLYLGAGNNNTCTFYTGGLTFTDWPDGRMQTAYDTAVSHGWTINNLTIASGAPVYMNYIDMNGSSLQLENITGKTYIEIEFSTDVSGDGEFFNILHGNINAYEFAINAFGKDNMGSEYDALEYYYAYSEDEDTDSIYSEKFSDFDINQHVTAGMGFIDTDTVGTMWNGTVLDTNTGTVDNATSLLSVNGSDDYQLRIYGIKMYHNYDYTQQDGGSGKVLTHYYRPAYFNINGEYGLFDTVTSSMYTNADITSV